MARTVCRVCPFKHKMVPLSLGSLLLLTGLLALGLEAADAVACRQGADAATAHCGLPDELSNFQGYYTCPEAVRVGKPHNKAELAALVAHFPRVKGVGIGHSWWGHQFCSGNDSSAINIVTTELDTTLQAIMNPVYYNASEQPPPEWPIQIDEAKKTVTVAAGVPQRILLDSLAKYTSPLAPNGYSIPAFPWYIDQTIAGAIATGTHGSSFLHGSVSSQTVRIEMALANGTLANFTKASNPILWHAAQVNVGRLGVMTEVELEIIPQDMVERTVTTLEFPDFVAALQRLQDDYNAAVAGAGPLTVREVLADYEGTQMFWFVPTNSTIWLSYDSLEAAALKELPASVDRASVAAASIAGSPPAAAPAVPGMTYSSAPATLPTLPASVMAAAVPQSEVPAMAPVMLPATDPESWSTLQYSFISGWLTNGTFTRRESILAETEFVNRATSDADPYDQYEFSFPLSTIGTCITRIADAMYDRDLLLGFPVPPLIRFVGEEQALISNANGGPRIFFNIEDHQSYQTGHANHRFDTIVEIMRGPDCQGRMHWGKAGWDKWANCFDGSVEYGKNWCHFGCAVQSLDPHGKFASQSDVWSWRATADGNEVPFNYCCDGSGFKSTCECAPRTGCTYTPPTRDQNTPR